MRYDKHEVKLTEAKKKILSLCETYYTAQT